MQPLVQPIQSGHLVIAMEFDSVDECLYTLHSDASLRAWKFPSPEAIVPDKQTATSTLERFQLMMSVQPRDAGLGITAVQAKMLLASRLKPDE
jgi:hypothetical protein